MGVQLERILCIIVEDSVQECQACFNSGSQPSRTGSAEHLRMEHHLPFFSMNGGEEGFGMKYTMLQNLSPFCPLCSLAPPFPCSRWRGDGKIAHSPDTAVILMETKMPRIDKLVDNIALSSRCSWFWNRNTGNVRVFRFSRMSTTSTPRDEMTLYTCVSTRQAGEGDYSFSYWYPTALWVITSFFHSFCYRIIQVRCDIQGL